MLHTYFLESSWYEWTHPIFQLFRQAYCLHHNEYVARRVILEAVWQLPAVCDHYQRRPWETDPYNRKYTPKELEQAITQWVLLQISILDVSEEWEKDQERPPSRREPMYQPTAPVMLTRFIKHLVFTTMIRSDSYPITVALGSCLFTYRPRDACLVANLIDDGRLANIARMPRQTQRRIATRFRHIFGEDRIPTKKPDFSNVIRDLNAFTPWGTTHFKEPPFVIEQLDHTLPDRQRMHALTCTESECAGFPKLVMQWNESKLQSLQLAEPTTMLEVPVFPHQPPSNSNDDDERFDPTVSDEFLNDLRISLINILKESSQRRRARPFELMRLCVDGVEIQQFGGISSSLRSFSIPAEAIRIQVYGRDDEGEIPLSIFYIVDLDENDTPRQLYHVMENGATFVLTISPMDEADIRQAQVQFWPDEELVPKTTAWYEAALTTIFRSLELAKVTGDLILERDSKNRLREFHRAINTSVTQGSVSAATITNLIGWTASLIEGLTQWISDLWTPEWAGVMISAADVQEDEHTFHMEHGEVKVTCDWGAEYQGTLAFIHLSWEANLAIACDIWVQFRQPDTGILLKEINLGIELSGEENLTHPTLGFDPTRERWGLTVMLKEPLP